MNASKGLILAGLLFPAVCLADAGNFNFVEGDYLNGEFWDEDVDGWGLRGSFELTDQVFITGGYNKVELDDDVPGLRLEGETTQIGVGYVFGENETGTFYGTASYVRADVTARAGVFRASEDDDGYGLSLGFRMNIGPQAELNAAVTHVELDEGGGDTIPSVGFVYKFTPSFAGVVNYSDNSGDTLLGLGVRFYF